MNISNLSTVVHNFKNKNIICFGDIMLDRFVYGSVSRTSPEAPVPVLLIDHEQAMLGGCGNAAANIQSLGANALPIGLIGNDFAGDTLTRLCEEKLGSSEGLVRVQGLPTIEKTRFIASSQQMLRVDNEDAKHELSDFSISAIKKVINTLMEEADGVLISDYAKGLVNEELCSYLINAANKKQIPVLVDPKGTDFTKYNGATVIKPNKKELYDATKSACDTNQELEQTALSLLNEIDVKALVVTRSEDGMSVIQKQNPIIHAPTLAKDVYDVSGAGDTVGATLLLSIVAGSPLEGAAHLSNIAGGIIVGKIGTAVLHHDDLIEALLDEESDTNKSVTLPGLKKLTSKNTLLEKVTLWRTQKLKIGFTNGYFDLIHPGHLSLFEQAKSRCDKLIVALNSDKSALKNKDKDTLIQDELSRAAVLGALEFIDAVILFDDETPLNLIYEINPDTLIKGGNYQVKDVLGHEFVLSQKKEVFLAEIDSNLGKTVSDLKRAG